MNSHNGEELRGYHKPIMLAGGMGNIRAIAYKKADQRRCEAGRSRRPGNEHRSWRRSGVFHGVRSV
ncbi:hypothetical protein ACLK17_15650 [Escherichia coli]